MDGSGIRRDDGFLCTVRPGEADTADSEQPLPLPIRNRQSTVESQYQDHR